jgi:predicted metal-binding protein
MAITEVTICTTCRRAGTPREAPADGTLLFLAVQAAADAAAFDNCNAPQLLVRGHACMSGCSHACTVSLQAPGKYSYYFGDLLPDEECAAQVLACAQLHQASSDGQLARNDRPERLRPGVLARLPPLSVAWVEPERNTSAVVEVT